MQYEGANHRRWGQGRIDFEREDAARLSDLVCPMYPTIDELSDWADEIAPRIGETRPLIMCEYAHAVGNSSGSLFDYWRVIREKRGLQGGFIWDWMDQGLRQVAAKDGREVVWHKYGGDYGDAPNDANFNINGMVSPERRPHPAMYEFRRIVQPVGIDLRHGSDGNDWSHDFTLLLTNDMHFLDLAGLVEGSVVLRVGGYVAARFGFELEKGRRIGPQSTVEVRLPELSALVNESGGPRPWSAAEVHLDVDVRNRDAESVLPTPRIEARAQFGLDGYLSPDRRQHAVLAYLNGAGIPRSDFGQSYPRRSEGEDGKFEMSTENHVLGITSDGSSFTLSARGDAETSKGRPCVLGLRPSLFRAGTDNDGVKQLGDQCDDESKPLGRWLSLGLDDVTLEDCEVRSSVCGTVETKAAMCGRPGRTRHDCIPLARRLYERLGDGPATKVPLGTWRQTLTMHPNGSLTVQVRIDVDEALRDLPRVGIEMAVPADLVCLRCFADGAGERDGVWGCPAGENYADRCLAAQSGVFEFEPDAADEYVVPQAQGNRMNLRWL